MRKRIVEGFGPIYKGKEIAPGYEGLGPKYKRDLSPFKIMPKTSPIKKKQPKTEPIRKPGRRYYA